MFGALLEFLAQVARALIWLLLGYLLAVGSAFAIAHIIDSWNAPEHPYSGFSPDYHTAHLDTP